MPNDPYVFTPCPTPGGDPDLSALRGYAIADAHARFLGAGGRDVVFSPGLDTPSGGTGNGVARTRFDELAIAFDWQRTPASGDPLLERWAQWLIEKLDAAGSIYQRSGEGWRLRTGPLHEENERRLGELAGWSDTAIAGQRKLLEHVEDPGDDGTELEQSLSKLAAAGWSVDSKKDKKDKKEPAAHFAAGDLPLARGDDWRAAGAVDPRLAAALGFFLAAVPPAERENVGELSALSRLPATAVAGSDDAAALLDVRTVAKALRDVGGLDLPSGEPLGPMLEPAPLRLRTTKGKGSSANGAEPADPNDVETLIAAHGADAVRFALLHAAAPTKRFRGGDDVVGYAAAFLAQAQELAAARLDGNAGERIDLDDGLRRRLAGWCDTAVARTAGNHEQLEAHRATRNAVTLLARISDFDAAVAEHRGEVAGADRDAVGIALTVLAQLLAPLAPSAASTLWQQAGRSGSPADAGWPQAQRQPAVA